MKSLERRFKSFAEKNPSWSSYTCFAAAIKGQDFGKERMRRWFHRLVDPSDYASDEKEDVLAFLNEHTKMAEAYMK